MDTRTPASADFGSDARDTPGLPKRRKLRKGTAACWQCKRRKMRCHWTEGQSVCVSCRSRGSECISQEFDDEEVSTTAASGDAMGGVPAPGLMTPTTPGSTPETTERLVMPHHDPTGSLSYLLHASLPSRHDIETICKASTHPSILPHSIMTTPYADLDHSGHDTLHDVLQIPGPTSHPVLIARHMLLLASMIQHLHPKHHRGLSGLREPPRAIMKRMVDLAVSHVTTKDQLTDNMEGLECVIIEAVYLANMGNLRQSWLACRRAMTIAQLLRLDRSDAQARQQTLQSNVKHHPKLMWFRLVFLDRLLCLMLGLPQGSLDRSMASDAILTEEAPMGRIERLHCVIASRILERNEADPMQRDVALTQTLDKDLHEVARSLPSKWWLTPTLDLARSDPSTLFWDMRRLFAQILHYNLLIQLHLPYLLRLSTADHQYEYSRAVCINSARDILSRVITLRSYNGVAHSCRIVDFIVLMAAMTLLLAHLENRQSGSRGSTNGKSSGSGPDLLSHQYYSDRAMIEEVQEMMEEVHRVHEDPLSARSAKLLLQLLSVEMTDSAQDQVHEGASASRVSVRETAVPQHGVDGTAVNVYIPYFGMINISRSGVRKKPAPAHSGTVSHSSMSRYDAPTRPGVPTVPQSHATMGGLQSNDALVSYIANPNTNGNSVASPPPTTMSGHNDRTLSSSSIGSGAPNLPTSLSSAIYDQTWSDQQQQQQQQYPALAAGAEAWAFQGTDWAYFDTVMGNDASVAHWGYGLVRWARSERSVRYQWEGLDSRHTL